MNHPIMLIRFSFMTRYLQVRAVSPFLGPPSDLAVVKMIPNERLPPRNLHRVKADKTQAVLKWQPPYDSPNTPLVRDCPVATSGMLLATSLGSRKKKQVLSPTGSSCLIYV